MGVMEMPHHTDGAIMAHRLVTLLTLTAVHLYLMGPRRLALLGQTHSHPDGFDEGLKR